MKHIIKSSLLLLVIAAISLASPTATLAAPQKNAADSAVKIEDVSRKARQAVQNMKDKLEQIDAETISETVVYEAPDDSCTETAIEMGNVDIDPCRDTKSSWEWSLLIPIFGIIFGVTVPFAALVLIIYFICKAAGQHKRLRYETIARAAEAGHPLPPAFYRSESRSPSRRLQSGIVWIGWGLAFALLGYAADWGDGWYAIAMVPLFIGISRLAVYFFEERKKRPDHNSPSGSEDAE